ncbi:hypothetical protein QA601_11710 [Chitinispirillales bacterium ANBcel5]|uniref:hypothetical protein n=1 Tax=Cellulosispirillum alkaliphilum TaxID=3039283 RepID=UPI002A4EE95E|nr:hypothetical protein [Chitinispirillales bacterium ANBcel5]
MTTFRNNHLYHVAICTAGRLKKRPVDEFESVNKIIKWLIQTFGSEANFSLEESTLDKLAKQYEHWECCNEKKPDNNLIKRIQIVDHHNSVNPNKLQLNNGLLHLKVDLTAGGAIAYLGESGTGRNLVNTSHSGSYIQQSYFAGEPLDRRAKGQATNCSPWGWNPVQAGDASGNRSKVLNFKTTEDQIYIKVQPLLWDMKGELAQCTMESWFTLSESAAKIRNRFSIKRTDNLWNEVSYLQEMPALSLIKELGHIYSCRRTETNKDGKLFSTTDTEKALFWQNPEQWVAAVDNCGWGLGVYIKDAEVFASGTNCNPRAGRSPESEIYISPRRNMRLDKSTVVDYEYDLIIGQVEQIRNYAINQCRKIDQPLFTSSKIL